MLLITFKNKRIKHIDKNRRIEEHLKIDINYSEYLIRENCLKTTTAVMLKIRKLL